MPPSVVCAGAPARSERDEVIVKTLPLVGWRISDNFVHPLVPGMIIDPDFTETVIIEMPDGRCIETVYDGCGIFDDLEAATSAFLEQNRRRRRLNDA